jgi:photoactive yellow protein
LFPHANYHHVSDKLSATDYSSGAQAMTQAATGTATTTDTSFSQAGLGAQLAQFTDADLDALDFGVIGFDGETVVTRYNSFESQAAGLTASRVLGQPLFTVVAPCMNNFMVAQRFEDAADSGQALDVTIDYVLTLRMRPVKVALRLIADPASATRYVLVRRAA